MEDKKQYELVLCENDPLQREDMIRILSQLAPELVIRPVTGSLELQQLLQGPQTAGTKRIFLMDIVLDNGEDGIDLAKILLRSTEVFRMERLRRRCRMCLWISRMRGRWTS